MSIGNVYSLYSAEIDGTLLNQMQSLSLDAGAEYFTGRSPGVVDPQFMAQRGQQAKIGFSTSAVKSALTLAGIGSVQVTAGAEADFYMQRLSAGGGYASGSVHQRWRVASGILSLKSLKASHDALATADFDVLCLSASGNDPIVVTGGQALPAGSPAFSEAYVAGPVSLNGTAIGGVQSITIDTGLKTFELGADGEFATTFAGYTERAPKITIRAINCDALTTFGFAAVAQSATDSVIYLRKVASGGKRVADATAEHIKLSIDDGIMIVKSSAPKAGEPAEIEVEIMPAWDGTNAVIAINTASAIT